MAEIRHTAKDSVFRNMFSRPKYTVQLYLALHPEDTETTEADIKNCTVNSIQSGDIYNDLGFLVGDRLIVLVEAQTTWSGAMPIRSMCYLAHSYLDYIKDTDIDLYGSAPIKLPYPELYMIYSKEQGSHPNRLSLRDDFFGGDCCVDAVVKVIYLGETGSIIDQYINYCRVFDEQTKLHRYTKKALKEIFRICIEKGYLAEYLTENRQEVMTMLEELFNQERQDIIRDNALIAQGFDRGIGIGREEGIGIGEARGIEIGEFNLLAALVRENIVSSAYAANKLGITVEEFEKRLINGLAN